MRELDRRTIELGTPGLELMERAGRGIACEILGPLGDAAARGVVVVAGRGNNGGDGFVVARLVAEHGWPVKVWLVGDPVRVAGDARSNLERWVAGGGKVETIAEEAPFPAQATADLGCAGVIVDALFGTGLNAPVGGAAARAIAAIAGARWRHTVSRYLLLLSYGLQYAPLAPYPYGHPFLGSRGIGCGSRSACASDEARSDVIKRQNLQLHFIRILSLNRCRPCSLASQHASPYYRTTRIRPPEQSGQSPHATEKPKETPPYSLQKRAHITRITP